MDLVYNMFIKYYFYFSVLIPDFCPPHPPNFSLSTLVFFSPTTKMIINASYRLSGMFYISLRLKAGQYSMFFFFYLYIFFNLLLFFLDCTKGKNASLRIYLRWNPEIIINLSLWLEGRHKGDIDSYPLVVIQLCLLCIFFSNTMCDKDDV